MYIWRESIPRPGGKDASQEGAYLDVVSHLGGSPLPQNSDLAHRARPLRDRPPLGRSLFADFAHLGRRTPRLPLHAERTPVGPACSQWPRNCLMQRPRRGENPRGVGSPDEARGLYWMVCLQFVGPRPWALGPFPPWASFFLGRLRPRTARVPSILRNSCFFGFTQRFVSFSFFVFLVAGKGTDCRDFLFRVPSFSLDEGSSVTLG